MFKVAQENNPYNLQHMSTQIRHEKKVLVPGLKMLLSILRNMNELMIIMAPLKKDIIGCQIRKT